MVNKKIMILALILLSLLTISSVSASEISDDSLLGVNDDEIVEISSDGTFMDLANEIANADGEINLTRNYVFSDGDGDYQFGINITDKITINGNGFAVDGKNQARAFSITGNNVYLNNIQFVNCYAEDPHGTTIYHGGAVCWYGNNGTLDNCSFVNNSASFGGAVYWGGVNGTLDNCSFVDCSARNDGGAVYWGGVNGTLDNCSFVNNSARDGGAVYWVGGALSLSGVKGTLANCCFVNNSARSGGAVYWRTPGGTLTDCCFVNNSVSDYGGAVYWSGVHSIVANCSFVNNSAGDGGAFYCMAWDCLLANCSFVNSYSEMDGGAVYWLAEEGVLANCTFVNSSSNCSGGAVYWQHKNSEFSGNNGALSNCSFANSSSGIEGGAVYWKAPRGTLRDCNFVNSSSESGGAVYWYGDKGTLGDCSFANNTVSSYGGAVYWYGKDPLLGDCSFVNNYAGYHGGAVYWRSQGVLHDSIFVNNSARFYAGALYGSCSVVSCIFVNNSAGDHGGAICGYKGIMDCIFVNNSASYGGALYSESFNGGNISNSIFIDNKAEGYLIDCYNNNNELIFTYVGNENYINAIYLYYGDNVINFDNVTYYYNGTIVNSDDVYPINSRNESGINITVELFDSNGDLLDNVTLMSDGDGRISYDYSYLPEGYYSFKAYHVDDSYYAFIEKSGVFIVGYENLNHLQEIINQSSPNAVVTLDRNYAFFEGLDNNLIDGIVIDKCNLTIDGNGYTIDALGKARMFNVISEGVSLTNINFMNGTSMKNGGAVYGNCSIVNCTFVNGSAYYGGAVYGNCSIVNCGFVNNSARWGGAVYGNCSIVNCTFVNDSAYYGGAVYGGSVVNCTFVNDSAYYGGAVYGGSVVNCSFVNDSAVYGGAVYGGSVVGCYFIANSADSGGALYWSQVNSSAVNCSFVNNFADEGGAIYCNAINCIVSNSSFIENKADSYNYFEYADSNATLTFTFKGYENYINAIYSTRNIAFKNVTYYNGNIVNSDLVRPFKSENEAGINITVEIFDSEGYLIDNVTLMTGTKGNAVYDYSNLDVGSYTYNAYHLEDSYYTYVETSGSFSVEKLNSSISVSYDAMYDELVATLTGQYGGKVSGENVVISLNGRNYTVKTDLNGQAKVSTADLSAANYTALVSFNGNDKYYSSGTSFGFTVKVHASISAVYNPGELVFTLTNDETAQPIRSANLNVNVNGTAFTIKTDSKGQVIISTADYGFGNYTASATYGGNSKYSPTITTIDFTVEMVDTNISVVYDSGALTVSLNDSYGNPVVGADVALAFNGNEYDLLTDDEGKAELSTAGLAPGNYNASALYAGDGLHYPSFATVDFTTEKADTSISVVYNALYDELTATLTISDTGDVVCDEDIVVYLDGRNYDVKTDLNGQAKFSTADLSSGNYTAVVSFNGDDNYNPSNISFDFALKVHTSISAVYNPGELVFTLTNDETSQPIRSANLNVNVNGTAFTIKTDSKGQVIISTADYGFGNYTASATYGGNSKYSPTITTIDFTVEMVDTNISVVYDAGACILTVLLTDAYDNPIVGADVGVVLNDARYDLTTGDEGQAELSTGPLAPGNYSGTVFYYGEGIYNPSNASFDFASGKADTNIFVVYDSIGHELTVFLTDAGSSPIIGADVSVILDDERHDLVTDLKGQAKVSTADLAQGTYDVAVSYAGDEMYKPSNATAQIVVKINTGLTAVYDDENSEVVVSLVNDATGQPIRSANVKLSIDGKSSTVKTDSNGQVKVSTSGLEAGTHFVVASYGGNSRYNPSSLNATFVIPESVDTSLSLAYDVGAGELVATLTNDLTGNPIAGEDIVFFIDDLDYAVKTDDAGQARLSTGDLAQGTYNVTASFEGDGKYSPSSASEVITVKLNTRIFVDDVTAEYGSDVELVASLIKDASGNPIKSANVRFTVNGKTYTVKTDANGQAKLTLSALNPGTYEATVSYYGNSIYNPSNATANVVVNKIVTASSLYYDSDAGELVAVVINTATGKGISGANVVFNLDGKKTSVKTDKQGQSRLSIGDADPNSFSVGISYAGNSKYLKSTSSIKIVEGKVPTVLSNSYDMAAGEVVATLTNFETGNAISGATVVFNVNGVKTSFKTNKTGQVKISLADFGLGELSVGTSYGGNSKYAGSGAGINIVKN